MADLFGLLQDLGERIASNGEASSSTQQDEEDPVEARFRSVLPNLLRSYFVPQKVKEREFTAILKLLCHTAKNYPGVFYHGKASAVLPIIGQVFPFFAEPAVSGRVVVLFETVGSLISLLRNGDRDVYRYIFFGATILLQDLVSVGSYFASSVDGDENAMVSVKCFSQAYSLFDANERQAFCDLPSHWKPEDGPGLLLNVAGNCRWQPLAEWTVKLVARILSEGAIHVEGLLTARLLSAIGSLICFGQPSLQKTCFELISALIPIVDIEMVPVEKIILTVNTILSIEDGWKEFRNAAYDSALGSCISALFGSLHRDGIEAMSHYIMEVFVQTVLVTESHELKVAFCSAFEMILKHCQPVTWRLEEFLQLLFVSDIRSHICKCMEYIVESLAFKEPFKGSIGFDANTLTEDYMWCSETERNPVSDQSREGGRKRKSEGSPNAESKRQKPDTVKGCGSDEFQEALQNSGDLFSGTNSVCYDHHMSMVLDSEEQKRACAGVLHKQILGFIKMLGPANFQPDKQDTEGILSAFQVIASLFNCQQDGVYYQKLLKIMELWMPWFNSQAEHGSLTMSQLCIFLEAVEILVNADRNKIFQGCEGTTELLNVLQLPWSPILSSKGDEMQRSKCCAIKIALLLDRKPDEVDFKPIYTLAIEDEDAFVRSKMVLSLSNATNFSWKKRIHELYDILGALSKDKSSEVREAVAETLGRIPCSDKNENSPKTLSSKSMEHGVLCKLCGLRESDYNVIMVDMEDDYFPLSIWQSLFKHLLFDETSPKVQVAFITSMSSILTHTSKTHISRLKFEWLKCLDMLPLHSNRAVRKAFCDQIKSFFHNHVLEGLFNSSERDSDNASKELQVLGKFKHALLVTEDPDLIESLLDMVAEIVLAASGRQQLFFFSFVLLLEQLDSKHVSVQTTSINLLRKCAGVQSKERDSVRTSLMIDAIQSELFIYLSGRLVIRSHIVQNYADAVLGIQTEDLIRQIVPVVLPKLVIQQQGNNDALKTLHSLARSLGTELPLLLLEWCHKVLSIILLKADGKDLMAALQFYEAQTGSDTREIFSAVLPALLDELVQFLGDTSTEDAMRRSARVPLMIQEVACIVSGSDELPGFLKTHFVGLLNSIDRKMLKAIDNITRKQGLRCINQLIDMIGCHLSAFIPKIMVLLTRAVQELSLQYEGLQVWLSFVRKLAEVCPANLKTVASQIVVSIMPCLESQKEGSGHILNAVVNVLEELIVKNRKILDDQAGELPLLPSLPELTTVNSVLQQARGVTTLHSQLRRAAEGIRHENVSVRLMASGELKKLISSRRKEVMSMLLGESSLDAAVLSDLVISLLQGCADESRSLTSEKFKLLCAECLGELGAVDPVRLNLNLHVRSKIERSDDDLVFELIDKHLVRVLRAASETDVQDAAALAIQEQLKLSGCKAAVLGSHDSTLSKVSSSRKGEKLSDTTDSLMERGEKLWSRFSDDIKDIITPCLTSKYLLKNANTPIPTGCIFRPGMSFRRWMYLWVRRLVLLSTGPRAQIFNACKGILRHDMATVLYLLPHIVLNVVCDGSLEARASVTDEILAVLAEAASAGNESMNGGDASFGNGGRAWSSPSEVSIQAVFTLLDNLAQWLDESKQDCAQRQADGTGSQRGQRSNMRANSNQISVQPQMTSQHRHVSELLEAIPKTALAGASFRCQAYARALLYFETHVRTKSGSLNPAAEKSGCFEDDDISFLLGVYSGLDEPDGLSGLSKLHKSLSLQDEVLINEKAGNWAEALTCCEQALQMDPRSVSRHEGVLNCLLNMGHLRALVTHVDGLLLRFPESKKEWSMWGVQAAWRLGQWGLLDEYVNGATITDSQSMLLDSSNGFDIGLAKVLLALESKDCYVFSKSMIQCRHALLAPLAAASMESYSRAYPLIIKLHMLHELEIFQEFFMENQENSTSGKLQAMVDGWEDRMKVTQPSLWAREPILTLRRVILTVTNMQMESGNLWLQYAKLCRAAGHYETANRAILEAQSAGAPNAHIELAKLLWDTKKSHRAIAELQQALAKVSGNVLGAARRAALGGLLHIPSGWSAADQEPPQTSETQKDENADAAKALLLLARWVHSTGQKQKEDVLVMYTRVKELQPKWEKSYFYLARYCDDLLVDARKRQEESQEQFPDRNGKQQLPNPMTNNKVDDKPWWTLLPDVILYYAKGLHKGHRRLFQALPRLLTLWFEFGSNYNIEALSSNAALKAVHARVMSIMRGCLKDLPTYQWLTAFSQLVSRICHQNEEVVRLVKHIIITVLQGYPQQALWTMAAVSKSTVAARRTSAAEILKVAKNGLRQESDKVLFTQFASLIDQLIRLCFHGATSKARSITLSNEFGYLKRMMPVGIIMPVQRALTVTLPSDGLTDANYNPFAAGDFSTISGINDEVEVLASLQRPKKVVLQGSDGKEYPFLCKPKDDLRKDARMMEFTTTINRLLSKDPKSRRRKLYIRTFAVIPLTEDCGMVEWVLHTRGLRHILQDIYVSLGKFDRQKTNIIIKQIYDQNQGKISEVDTLRNQILPMFPPVFHKWFLNTFSEPANWFQSRVAYAHTTAVWSMVGHIVGLGDRHGENILFDSTTGDCVHVDFSCLFDKGLQLEKPELVPFRLTQNMVDGLGITGYEGVFSRVCEITLSVLRSNRDTLMSVLETFIHDPLVEWTKSHKSSGVEVKNPHAQRALSNIKARLQGVVVGVGAAPSLPLSVEGQANQLITEAVSHENLGRMYIWWMPWF